MIQVHYKKHLDSLDTPYDLLDYLANNRTYRQLPRTAQQAYIIIASMMVDSEVDQDELYYELRFSKTVFNKAMNALEEKYYISGFCDV